MWKTFDWIGLAAVAVGTVGAASICVGGFLLLMTPVAHVLQLQ